MNVRSAPVRLMALGLIFAMLAVMFRYSNYLVMQTCAGLGAVFTLSALVGWVIIRRQHDPYSLESLREIMIEGTYNEDDVPDVDPDGDLFCVRCGTVYGRQFGVCPHCKCR
jgi:hypothetical protein